MCRVSNPSEKQFSRQSAPSTIKARRASSAVPTESLTPVCFSNRSVQLSVTLSFNCSACFSSVYATVWTCQGPGGNSRTSVAPDPAHLPIRGRWRLIRFSSAPLFTPLARSRPLRPSSQRGTAVCPLFVHQSWLSLSGRATRQYRGRRVSAFPPWRGKCRVPGKTPEGSARLVIINH